MSGVDGNRFALGGSPGLSSGLDALRKTDLDGLQRDAAHADVDAVGESFGKLFATMLMRELRRSMEGIGGQGLFGDGAGADVYEAWFDEHLGESLAQRDVLGIAGLVKANLTRARAAEAASEPSLAAQDDPIEGKVR